MICYLETVYSFHESVFQQVFLDCSIDVFLGSSEVVNALSLPSLKVPTPMSTVMSMVLRQIPALIILRYTVHFNILLIIC